MNAEWGVEPDAVSTLDIARYRDTGEDWPVVDGYGALVARAAADVVDAVALDTPVEAIRYDPAGVRVATPQGVIEAGAAIVTASTTVLASDVIAFEPMLPLRKREALAAVPLGSANKVALQFAEAAMQGIDEQGISAPVGSGQRIGLRLRPYGHNLIDAYLGGSISADLEAAGERMMVETVLEAIAALLGNEVKRSVVASVVSRWGSEPFIRGGYAAALPGSGDRRADLRGSVGGRLFFAGEATSPEFFSTCHGAWLTGVAAAEAAAQALGREMSAEAIEIAGIADSRNISLERGRLAARSLPFLS